MKSIVFYLCLFGSLALTAQNLLPTRFFMNGSFNFSKNKFSTSDNFSQFNQSEVTETNRSVSLNGAGFLTQRLAVGMQTNWGTTQSSSVPSSRNFNATENDFKTSSWQGGPMVRYYMPVGKTYGLALQSSGVWGERTLKTDFMQINSGGFASTVSGTFAFTNFDFDISPVAYILFKRVALEVQLGGYNYSVSDPKKSNPVQSPNNFFFFSQRREVRSNFRMNLQYFIFGVSLFLGKMEE